MTAPRMVDSRWQGAALLVVLALAGVWLGAISLRVNLQMACQQQEWPQLSSCPEQDLSVASQVSGLRSRLAANPGDSAAWLALALLTQQAGGVAPLSDDKVLAVATRLAGEDLLLQRVLAARALESGQWANAVKWLVRLVEIQRDATAARTLTALLANPEALAAMRAALKPDSKWLVPMLGQLERARVAQAMPLVADGLALMLVTPATGQALMRNLKADGQWLDAHALWVYLVGGQVPLLYNGQFEQGFIADGFDWEVVNTPPSLAGVKVFQPTLGARGKVLQLDFSGRRLAMPLVRQLLVLPEGEYVFTGQYMARKLRSEQGLVWTFSCAGKRQESARSSAMLDTQGVWKKLEVTFAVPSDCGAIALQLQTSLTSEALTGLRGQMFFDDFSVLTQSSAVAKPAARP